MTDELREAVATFLHGVSGPSMEWTDSHWDPEYRCLIYGRAARIIAAATPIIRRQMLLELIGKAKGTSGTICMWDGEGRDNFLTVAEWLDIYLTIESEE